VSEDSIEIDRDGHEHESGQRRADRGGGSGEGRPPCGGVGDCHDAQPPCAVSELGEKVSRRPASFFHSCDRWLTLHLRSRWLSSARKGLTSALTSCLKPSFIDLNYLLQSVLNPVQVDKESRSPEFLEVREAEGDVVDALFLSRESAIRPSEPCRQVRP
jgi:hypothetical protein